MPARPRALGRSRPPVFLHGHERVLGASDGTESLATLAGAANARLVDQLGVLAREWGLTNAQVALSWLLVRPSHVIPIPGHAPRQPAGRARGSG